MLVRIEDSNDYTTVYYGVRDFQVEENGVRLFMPGDAEINPEFVVPGGVTSALDLRRYNARAFVESVEGDLHRADEVHIVPSEAFPLTAVRSTVKEHQTEAATNIHA